MGCALCGREPIGFTCVRCHAVFCPECAAALPPRRIARFVGYKWSHCPECNGRVTPILRCFRCGERPRHLFGLSTGHSWHCVRCGLNYCTRCANEVDWKPGWFGTHQRLCPSCGGVIKMRQN